MIECAGAAEELGERGLRREAPLPRLPCLQSDNCIRTSRRKQLFVAQENLRLYIWKHGDRTLALSLSLRRIVWKLPIFSRSGIRI